MAEIARIVADLRSDTLTAAESADLIEKALAKLQKPKQTKKKLQEEGSGRPWTEEEDWVILRHRIKHQGFKALTYARIADELNKDGQTPRTPKEVLDRSKIAFAELERRIMLHEEELERLDDGFVWLAGQDDVVRYGLYRGESLATIAEKLGVHEATIRTRVLRIIDGLLRMNYHLREDDEEIVQWRAIVAASARAVATEYKAFLV